MKSKKQSYEELQGELRFTLFIAFTMIIVCATLAYQLVTLTEDVKQLEKTLGYSKESLFKISETCKSKKCSIHIDYGSPHEN